MVSTAVRPSNSGNVTGLKAFRPFPQPAVRARGIRARRGLGSRLITRTPAPGRVLCEASAETAGEVSRSLGKTGEEVYGPSQTLSPIQAATASVPPPMRLGLAAAIVGGTAAGAANLVGGAVRVDGSRTGIQIASAAVVGGTAAIAAQRVEKEHIKGSAIAIHNSLSSLPEGDDFLAVESAISAVKAQFGFDEQSAEVSKAIQQAYYSFLLAVLPPSENPLIGDEADKLSAMIGALNLDEGAAAEVHLEVGRRIFRQRMETSSTRGSGPTAERKEFQKLVFISTLVFGERKSKFLLPWKRIFDFSEAQVSVACRENASRLYRSKLESVLISKSDSPLPTEEELLALKNYQETLGLDDYVAAQELVAVTRKRTEAHVQAAYEKIRVLRARGSAAAVDELKNLLAYNKHMVALGTHEELAPGVGAVSLLGGSFVEGERAMSELRELYKTYLESEIKEGDFTESLQSDMDDLKRIFGLGNNEALDLQLAVQKEVYVNRLRNLFSTKKLDEAESKAAVLNELVTKLRFEPTEALAIHTNIYRDRLKNSLDDEKIDEKDYEQLTRIRLLLCIQDDVIDKARLELCGEIYRKLLNKVLAAGVDGFGDSDALLVEKCQLDLRLKENEVLQITGEVVRSVMLQYIKEARSKPSKLESAKELRRLIFFSNLVVVRLLEKIKPEVIKTAKAPEQPVNETEENKNTLVDDAEEREEMQKQTKVAAAADAEKAIEEVKAKLKAKADEQAKAEGKDWVPASVVKEKTATAVEGLKYQDYFNLAEDLEIRERQDLYKTYLLYCLTGDVKTGPMGTQMVIERDQSEFLRLQQLGSVLGLDIMQTANVHQELSEQAFKQQVNQIFADGKITKEKSEQVKKLQEQFGLPDELAKKVIKGITSAGLIKNIEAEIAKGKMTIDSIADLRAAEVDVEGVISESVRMSIFRKRVETALSNGSGEFDEEELLVRGPEVLGIDTEKARGVVSELGQEKKRINLINAAAALRRKNNSEALEMLKNVLACHSAAKDVKLAWNQREDLFDFYSVFAAQEEDESERSRLAHVFELSDAEKAMLDSAIESGEFVLKEEEALF